MTEPVKLSKPYFKALGRLFEAEIDGRTVQSKAAVFKQLEVENFAYLVTEELGGRFPVTVSYWALTHAGRYAYCSNCDAPKR